MYETLKKTRQLGRDPLITDGVKDAVLTVLTLHEYLWNGLCQRSYKRSIHARVRELILLLLVYT